MTKADLRKQFLAERKALSAEDVERWSLAIGESFFKDVCRAAPILFGKMTSLYFHTFLPIVRQNEVDTWPIIHRIWREFPEIIIAISVTDPVSQTLTHYELTPETVLAENRWGILEPLSSEQPRSDVSAVSSKQLDVVLVPLLAFDRHGHRVGYGGGYYDRFLAECRPDCLKIGLSLFEPVELIKDIEETDVPLDACITPEQVFTF